MSEPSNGKVQVGVWSTDNDGMITVAYLGTASYQATQLGGHQENPETLARLMFTEALGRTAARKSAARTKVARPATKKAARAR